MKTTPELFPECYYSFHRVQDVRRDWLNYIVTVNQLFWHDFNDYASEPILFGLN